ncbi:hypothetical protein [uncultured Psychroserpens sp.]|uniref:hypothetical protein n=1 Tax=uncultured Psychroserpens sp. TaxID=255436 RepID=UPI00260F146C|nr:hypothetical protein [uncultured Psychroserpens sp.]
MKRILTLTLFICLMSQAFAQTDGISYQAVIISPDNLELPGVDSEGNYLPNTTIAIRFTIYDSGNQIEFQEVQVTNTDEFGRINLLIGDAEHDYFKEISWDGTPKDLKVEIDFDAGNNFETMSRERLTFLPYAYHRNITATGTLTVDDRTYLNGELQVEGPTNLSSTLDVNNGNATNLTGTLDVDGIVNLNEAFNVNNASPSTLTGDLGVNGNTALDGTLDVLGLTTLNDLIVNGEASFGDLTAETLKVTDSTHLDGGLNVTSDSQVKITSTLNGSDLDINKYPLLIEGGNQGIAIKVNAVGARNENNYISFWDETSPSDVSELAPLAGIGGAANVLWELLSGGAPFEPWVDFYGNDANTVSGVTIPNYDNAPMLWGRIEGETVESEFTNNADYNLDRLNVIYDVVDGSLDLVWQTIDVTIAGIALTSASADVRACVGFGACVVSPGPAKIAAEIASLALEIIKEIAAIANEIFAVRNLQVFDYNKQKFKGVSYASGAGDYAEYLIRADINETMSYGDIVGVNGGKISKTTNGSHRMMVISYKPIVLGALPQPQLEKYYEKVAFMGQVPVKVYGKVNIGDYILPSGNNDGIGIAVSPADIKPRDIKNIVGVAWESVDFKSGFNYVNVAVGLNANDTSPFIEKLEEQFLSQANEINELKKLLQQTIERIVVLENGTSVTDIDNSHLDEDATSGMSADGRNYTVENDIIYYEITDADIENGLKLAEKMMQDQGIDTMKHLVWKKLKEDPSFKLKFTNSLKDKFDQHIHYHKEVIKEAKN